MIISSWISPKTIKGQQSNIHHKGFFAMQDIKKGEVLAIKAGHIIDKTTLNANEGIIQHSEVQIDDDIYLAPMTLEELPASMIYCNHSCEPNMEVRGQIILVASRNITSGEELTVDYGTTYDNNSHFECNCGAPNCRKVITGKDWQNKEIQDKYGQSFSWFILEKIKRDNVRG